jgi:hypothetical protein
MKSVPEQPAEKTYAQEEQHIHPGINFVTHWQQKIR